MGTSILVCNHKGGVGKTMLSVHLACWAQRNKLRTVAIDTDPQGAMMHWHSRSQLAGLEFPEVLLLRPRALRDEWAGLTKKYDAIVIDTPPTMGVVIDEFAPDVTTIVVPVTPAGLELDALQTTLARVPADKTRLVLNRCDRGTGAREVRRVLDGFRLPLHVVRDYVAFRDATLGGGTVLGRYPSGPAAEDVRRLAREVWS